MERDASSHPASGEVGAKRDASAMEDESLDPSPATKRRDLPHGSSAVEEGPEQAGKGAGGSLEASAASSEQTSVLTTDSAATTGAAAGLVAGNEPSHPAGVAHHPHGHYGGWGGWAAPNHPHGHFGGWWPPPPSWGPGGGPPLWPHPPPSFSPFPSHSHLPPPCYNGNDFVNFSINRAKTPEDLCSFVEAGYISVFSCDDVAFALSKLLHQFEAGRGKNPHQSLPPRVEMVAHMLAERGLQVFPQIDKVKMSQVLHAFAVSPYRPDRRLMKILQHRLFEIVPTYASIDLSKQLWALAKLRENPREEVWCALEKQILAAIGGFYGVDISHTLWSFATLHRNPSYEILSALQRQGVKMIQSFNPQNIANSLWAFPKMGHVPSREFYEAVGSFIQKYVGGFKAQEISNCIWAFASLGYDQSDGLRSSLDGAAENLAWNFNAQNVTNVLWAHAHVGRVPSDRLMNALIERVGTEQVLKDFKVQGFCNLVWVSCFLSIGAPHHAQNLLRAIAPAASKILHMPHEYLAMEDSDQLHQFFVACDVDEKLRADLPPVYWDLKAAKQQECREHWCKNSIFTCSLMQRTLSNAIRDMGLVVQDEVKCPRTAYSIDCLTYDHKVDTNRAEQGLTHDMGAGPIDNPGRWTWAVEYDGPRHYVAWGQKKNVLRERGGLVTSSAHDLPPVICTADKTSGPVPAEASAADKPHERAPTGATLIKKHHLKLAGWNVVSIPFFTWDNVKELSRPERVEFIKQALLEVAPSAEITEAPPQPYSLIPKSGVHSSVGELSLVVPSEEAGETGGICSGQLVTAAACSRQRRGLDIEPTAAAESKGAGSEGAERVQYFSRLCRKSALQEKLMHEVRVRTEAARNAMATLDAADTAAHAEKEAAIEEAKEQMKLSQEAELEAADATIYADEAERLAREARQKADELAAVAR